MNDLDKDIEKRRKELRALELKRCHRNMDRTTKAEIVEKYLRGQKK